MAHLAPRGLIVSAARSFLVRIVDRETKSHARGLDDHALALVLALRALGCEAHLHHELPEERPEARLVVLGLSDADPGFFVPPDAVLYNSEQVLSGQHWKNLDRYKDNPLWDYSREQVHWFRARGARGAVHCPVGFVPGTDRIGPSPVEDIDVLFYGWVCERRREVIEALTRAGLRVRWLVGVFGRERDRLVARSKVVLNLHFYERPVFEIFRVGHLLASGRCVVSEDGGVDPELEDLARRATAYTPRGEIVRVCRDLVASQTAREEVARRGRAAFREVDFVQSVRTALAESGGG